MLNHCGNVGTPMVTRGLNERGGGGVWNIKKVLFLMVKVSLSLKKLIPIFLVELVANTGVKLKEGRISIEQ